MNRLSWDEYFIKVAETIAQRSADPRTKVGAVITDKNNVIIGTGYNGFPSGFPDTDINWSPENKYKYVIHAEANAIKHMNKNSDGFNMYVTLEPCELCMGLIINELPFIEKIVFKNERVNEISRELAKKYGIVFKPIDKL